MRNQHFHVRVEDRIGGQPYVREYVVEDRDAAIRELEREQAAGYPAGAVVPCEYGCLGGASTPPREAA